MPKDARVPKSRSGTETRQRTDRVALRLLPAEGDALRKLAQQYGHHSVQALILDALRPLIASAGSTLDRGWNANLAQRTS
jgi:hypothetical protein